MRHAEPDVGVCHRRSKIPRFWLIPAPRGSSPLFWCVFQAGFWGEQAKDGNPRVSPAPNPRSQAGRELECLHINILARSHLHEGKKKPSKQKEHEKLIRVLDYYIFQGLLDGGSQFSINHVSIGLINFPECFVGRLGRARVPGETGQGLELGDS